MLTREKAAGWDAGLVLTEHEMAEGKRLRAFQGADATNARRPLYEAGTGRSQVGSVKPDAIKWLPIHGRPPARFIASRVTLL